jgi:uncharacterized protein (TIGR02271 family)
MPTARRSRQYLRIAIPHTMSFINCSAILTVDGANHPELAAQIMSRAGGQLITRSFGTRGFAANDIGTAGSSTGAAYAAGTPGSAADVRSDNLTRTDRQPAFATTAARTASPSESELERKYAPPADRPVDPELATTDYVTDSSLPDREMSGADAAQSIPAAGRTADVNSYDDFGKYRAGALVDESTRLQLREERLRVDKSRFDRGVATVGTDVVTENQEPDVPYTREELFIERRPANGSTVSSTPEMGGADAIRVPLSEERVTVNRVPIITKEIVVGKREVQDTQHISETIRKEKLNVADAGTTVGAGGERRDWKS